MTNANPIPATSQPDTSVAAPRQFLATIVATALGCGVALGVAYGIYFVTQPSMDGLGDKTLSSLSDFIKADDQLRLSGIKVSDVSVMRGSGNLFEGVATVEDGTVPHQVPLHIVWDGEQLMWSTEPGAFLFALR